MRLSYGIAAIIWIPHYMYIHYDMVDGVSISIERWKSMLLIRTIH